MVWTLILNGSTGLIMVITFAFCIPDIDMALTPTYNFTYIDVFFNQTNSRAGASIMTAILTLMTLCATISAVATASRQLFAFARDNGLPWASFISRVRHTTFLRSFHICSPFFLLLIITTGTSRLGHPSQRRRNLMGDNMPPLARQPRQRRRL